MCPQRSSRTATKHANHCSDSVLYTRARSRIQQLTPHRNAAPAVAVPELPARRVSTPHIRWMCLACPHCSPPFACAVAAAVLHLRLAFARRSCVAFCRSCLLFAFACHNCIAPLHAALALRICAPRLCFAFARHTSASSRSHFITLAFCCAHALSHSRVVALELGVCASHLRCAFRFVARARRTLRFRFAACVVARVHRHHSLTNTLCVSPALALCAALARVGSRALLRRHPKLRLHCAKSSTWCLWCLGTACPV